MSEQVVCPCCAGFLGAEQRESYQCGFCGTVTPHAALIVPHRTPIDQGIDRLWKVVAGDFDRDGWFELCGWDDHTLYALDPVDKTMLWKTLEGSKDDFDLFVGPGRIYVCTERELIALEAYTGRRVWSAAVYNVRRVFDPGYVAGGVIWVNVADEQLFTIDRATGAQREDRKITGSGQLQELSGQNLVWNDIGVVTVLGPTDQIVMRIGGSMEQIQAVSDAATDALMRGQKRINISLPDTVDSVALHRGVLYVELQRGKGGFALEAYRTSDGKLVGRRSFETYREGQLIAAVSGHAITKNWAALEGEPGGLRWKVPGEDGEIEWARGIGSLLVVLYKRRQMGEDAWDLIALDATFAQVWKIENLGYVYGEIAASETLLVVTIQPEGAQTLIGIDPASGARLWEAGVPREEGTACGGGLVWQTRYGTAVFAASGQQIFPIDRRSATPAVAPLVSAPDELPNWGPAPAVAPETNPARKPLLIIFGGMALLILGLAIAMILTRHK